MSSPADPPHDGDVLERAAAALDAGDAVKARVLAQPLTRAHDADVRHEALAVVAHAWFHAREFEHAAEGFARLVDDRGLAVDWFQLATSSALAGRLEQAQRAFDTCIAGTTPLGGDAVALPPPAHLRRWFALALLDAGFAAASLDQVEELMRWHLETRAIDDAHCAREGIPSFASTIELAERVLREVPRDVDRRAWIARMSECARAEASTGPAVERITALQAAIGG